MCIRDRLLPITLTAIVCGVTEPIEFTFLFIAPVLFVVHAVLAATLATVANALGVVGVLSGGLIEIDVYKRQDKFYLMIILSI